MRLIILLLALLAPAAAAAQSTILQGGPWTSGHAPMYSSPGGGQPVVQDSGPAGGGSYGVGLSELLQVNRGAGAAPYASNGTGPYSTHACFYDGPITGAYHYLCLDANAYGGGLIAYGAGGGATPLGLNFIVNGVEFPAGASSGQYTFTVFYTIGTIPACVGGSPKTLLAVSDGVTSPGYRSAYAGGGASYRLVFCDSVFWAYN